MSNSNMDLASNMQTVESHSSSVKDVINSFLDLPRGWHYGQGRGATGAAVKAALRVDRLFQESKAHSIEAFPDVDGGILICGRWENEDVEIICFPDGVRFSLCHDKDDSLELEHECITFDDVSECMQRLSRA